MKISKEQLTKFKEIYREQFGFELDDETAYDLALKLLNLMRLVYKQINQSDFNAADKRRKELDGNK